MFDFHGAAQAIHAKGKINMMEQYISYALKLSQKNLGRTAPNPVVGCVIVKDGVIISSGVTSPGGRPHAEQIAIQKISDKKILEPVSNLAAVSQIQGSARTAAEVYSDIHRAAPASAKQRKIKETQQSLVAGHPQVEIGNGFLEGAELYVTLEPCSHFGQTTPCVDEIIKHKFKKVVIATLDPDPRVNGEGIRKLREAGIDVVCGVLEKEAQEINRGFFTAKKFGRPFVTLKLATSLDNKIATKNFDSKWITGEKARQFSHLLRAKNDAILVGANTFRKDAPRLDCRLSGLEEFSPRIVVLSHENFNAELEDILKQLCAEGVNSLLVEGGQNVAT
ncbi:MAG: bifunctional diaminohydroxyphosphoribosylaminopyrimidine deaminase/5-amino-6-(5-phosphoribosylamino)uracil reductase RibD, partial [Alphaproteobacteria bacterium]|nr:bifunctional diaminohydroxyphosphoribosylaminopyrimidine deaminase/5-amino-6-(5-phosphoribosylamino)uracil reductase RibD [Alphaproteobacteria bacterium]